MMAFDQKYTELKDVPNIPEGIINAARAGRLVLFIGAGASRIIGCPSWSEFAHLQLKDLYEKKAINYYEYTNLKSLDARKLLSICRNIYIEKKIQPPNMNELFAGKENLINRFAIYDDLYAFKAVYITTNYDDYLDRSAKKSITMPISNVQKAKSQDIVEQKSEQCKTIYSKEQLLTSNLSSGNVLHLHGSINDERSLVVTIVDYVKHYEHGSKPAVLLEKIFEDYIVLFIGYGLEEYEILEFIIGKSKTSKGELKHFMLYPIFKAQTNLLDFYKKYYADLGIQLIPYPIDERGYEHLSAVIHEWSKQIGPISRPQGFLEKIRLIDEVI